MNNEEKARELSKKFARQYHANNWPEWSDDEAFHYSNEEINNACLEMAEWKEQQMIDRAKEFISTWFYEHPHTSWLICSDEFQDLDDCLERLEREMKEENND